MDFLIRRTAPCPCGSGRRFKHCHGSAALALLELAVALEPNDERLWWAMLELIARGEVRDDEIGIRELPAAARSLRVAVITPYFKEDLGELQRCHASVQGHAGTSSA